jgi:hypothetical protein
MPDGKKRLGWIGFALSSVVLITLAVVHFVMSIQPGDGFDRSLAFEHQCLTLVLCIAATICACVGLVKAGRNTPKNYVAIIVIDLLIGLCVLAVLLALVGVASNAEIIFFGGSER